MYEAYDSHFADAVRKAASGLKPDRTDGKYTLADDLAKLLRSDMQLGAGERELLAQLVSGDLQNPAGKQGVNYLEKEKVVKEYNELIKKGTKRKQALYDVATKFSYGESTIRSWVQDARDREKIISNFSNL